MPALPAAAAPVAQAAPVANEFMYGMAVFNARLRGASSTAKIARDLGIGKEAAASLQSRMVREGFVGLPNATGLSRTTEPLVRTDAWHVKLREKARAIAEEKLDDIKETLIEGETEPDGDSLRDALPEANEA